MNPNDEQRKRDRIRHVLHRHRHRARGVHDGHARQGRDGRSVGERQLDRLRIVRHPPHRRRDEDGALDALRQRRRSHARLRVRLRARAARQSGRCGRGHGVHERLRRHQEPQAAPQGPVQRRRHLTRTVDRRARVARLRHPGRDHRPGLDPADLGNRHPGRRHDGVRDERDARVSRPRAAHRQRIPGHHARRLRVEHDGRRRTPGAGAAVRRRRGVQPGPAPAARRHVVPRVPVGSPRAAAGTRGEP